MFTKLRLKPHATARVLYPPDQYPMPADYHWTEADQADFVHVFVSSRADFARRFPQAAQACRPDSLFWLSYPKAQGKKTTYDINRDSLWALLIDAGYRPVSQVALDGEWSALRVKANPVGAVPPKT